MRPISWLDIIDQAEKRGRFSDLDRMEAADWATCAVGEQRSSRTEYVNITARKPVNHLKKVFSNYGEDAKTGKEIPWYGILNHSGPRNWDGDKTPENAVYKLGMEFMYAVQRNEFALARKILEQLHTLWAEVKADLPDRLIRKRSLNAQATD